MPQMPSPPVPQMPSLPPPITPTFSHEDPVINSFVNMILKIPQKTRSEMPIYDELLIMCGVYTNNVEIVKYACDCYPGIEKRIISQDTLKIMK